MKMKFKVAVVSDTGLVRGNNEDNFFVPRLEIKQMQAPGYEGYTEFTAERAYMCVCDGMGGHSCGEVASFLAVKETEKQYMYITGDEIVNNKKLNEVMQRFIEETNNKLYYRSERDVILRSMGTTMSGLYFMKNSAYFVNVGDSRSYELKKTKINQLSIDHSDSVSKNAITRYLGMSPEFGRMEADIAFTPSKIGSGCRYILCSDGLTDMLPDDSIAGLALSNGNTIAAARELVAGAKKNGGHDNITVIVIDASPAGAAAKAIHNKVVVCCLAAALTAGAAWGGVSLLKRGGESAGDDFATISSKVEKANNLIEAREGLKAMLSGIDASINEYNVYSDAVEESSPEIAAANSGLREAIWDFKLKRDALEKRINEIISGKNTDDEKLSLLQNITADSAYKAVETAKSYCAEKKAETENCVAAYAEYLKQIQQTPTTKPTKKPTNNGSNSGSNSGSGGNNSGSDSGSGGNNSGSDSGSGGNNSESNSGSGGNNSGSNSGSGGRGPLSNSISPGNEIDGGGDGHTGDEYRDDR